MPVLSEYARMRLCGVTNSKRRDEILLGDAVRAALFVDAGLENCEIALRDGGKPYPVGHENVSFNISHSENLAVGALVTDSGEIGADIEMLRAYQSCRDRITRIASRAFTSGEQRLLDSSENKARTFYEIWTKKEAYLKFTGQGITVPLASVDTEKMPPMCVFRTFTVADSMKNDYILTFCISPSCEKSEFVLKFI